jgi:chromosome partitioning protein
MGETIGVLNYKGGTGKTTTVVNLAAGLALRGKKVLCIDLDAQGNLASYFGSPRRLTLAQLLSGEATLRDCIVNARERLDLIVSDERLWQAERDLWLLHDGKEARQILCSVLKDLDGYDYIILDHSPSGGLLNECGLFYEEQLIVPVSMDYLSLLGLRRVMGVIRSMTAGLERCARVAIILPTFFNPRLRKDREIMAILESHFASVLAYPIRSNVSLCEAPGHRKSIYEYAPRSTGAMDYAFLVERVAANGN